MSSILPKNNKLCLILPCVPWVETKNLRHFEELMARKPVIISKDESKSQNPAFWMGGKFKIVLMSTHKVCLEDI